MTETLKQLEKLAIKLHDDGADYEAAGKIKEADVSYHRCRVIEDTICVIDELLAEAK